jgi:hypothetical protein
VDGDHGFLRWSLLLYHLWHRLRCHLRLPLRLHHVLRDSFGVRGSLIGAGPRVTPTASSATTVPTAVAASEEEDLGKKGNQRMKPHKKKKKKEKRGRESWTN